MFKAFFYNKAKMLSATWNTTLWLLSPKANLYKFHNCETRNIQ